MKLNSQLPTTAYQLPLIVIVGPTASGKTSLAIEIAKKCNGEIICADSRSIYRGLDAGTAKPTLDERENIPHWGLDIANPGDYFTVADFKDYADMKIAEIRSRGRIPFLVGGTGLYTDSVMFDYKFGPPADTRLRDELNGMSLDELYIYCIKHNVKLPENNKNKRYVIRAIETMGNKKQIKSEIIDNTVVVGISTDKSILKDRIIKRADDIVNKNTINEAINASSNYGWDNEAMKSNIYPLIHMYLDNKMSLDEVKEKFITLDWRLAKRQLTWLRRNKYIQWFSLNDAKKFLSEQLAIHS